MPKCRYCGKEFSMKVIKIHEKWCQKKEKKTVSRKSGQEARANVEQKEPQEINWEEEVKQYYTSGGWYDLPGYEKSLRKDEAIEALKKG